MITKFKKTPSFGDLLAEQIPYLRRIARRYQTDEEDQHDLASDVLLKALSSEHLFIAGSNLRGWLSTIMHNTFINQYRVSKRRGATVDLNEILVDTGISDFSTPNLGPALLAEAEVNRLLTRLKPELLVIVESRMKGMKYEEIAEALQIPCGTVKNRLHLARKTLLQEV